MKHPNLSLHFQNRAPSAIRLAQIEFMKRTDSVVAVNTAIGNVSLPMHPAMMKRMFSLSSPESPFAEGAVKYSATVGFPETNQAILHVIESSGFSREGLHSQITDGGSHAMELAILGICGPAGSKTGPLLVFDPLYSNYVSMAERTGRMIVAVSRSLEKDGKFHLPKELAIEKIIQEMNPAGLLVIPYDNPTGQFFSQKTLNELGRLCVKYNLWLLSDEAYRELFYLPGTVSSIWGVTEKEVPGIQGRRISIESASKVWNACGLRIGALVSDNLEFHQRAVAENTANLCANVLGQYIFGALLQEPKEKLQTWFREQREYYRDIAFRLTSELKQEVPDLIVSEPDASLYTVIDFRNIFGPDFRSEDFAMFCAQKGSVLLNGVKTTLLMAPMEGFYCLDLHKPNPGRMQMRIGYVEPAHIMAEVPRLFAQLLSDFRHYIHK